MAQAAGAIIAIVGAAAGAVTGAWGAWAQGNQKADELRYQESLDKQNEAVAKANANIVSTAGSEQAYMASQKTRSAFGAFKAQEGASGVDVNSGSSVDVQASIRELGQLDALTVRSNATKEAYGFVNKANEFHTQADMDEYAARSAMTAGTYDAVNSLLSGGIKAFGTYNDFKQSGALGGGNSSSASAAGSGVSSAGSSVGSYSTGGAAIGGRG